MQFVICRAPCLTLKTSESEQKKMCNCLRTASLIYELKMFELRSESMKLIVGQMKLRPSKGEMRKDNVLSNAQWSRCNVTSRPPANTTVRYRKACNRDLLTLNLIISATTDMMQAYSRDRKQQNMTEITAFRTQIVQETRAERMSNLTAIQRAKEQDKSWCAERSREIRVREKTAIQRRDQLKKNQQKELVKNARASLATEHQKKVQHFSLRGMKSECRADLVHFYYSLCRKSSSRKWRERKSS